MPVRLLCWFVAALSGAVSAAETTSGTAVVPPGYEALFAAMLGQGEQLSAGCVLTDAGIERTSVHARYRCPSGSVAIELQHPQRAPMALRVTERFAIAAVGGMPPATLLDVLESRLRAREKEFEWSWIPVAEAEEENTYSTTLWQSLLGALLLLALAATITWGVRRRLPVSRQGRIDHSGLKAAAKVTVAALAFAAAGHGALWLTGASFSAMLRGDSLASIALRAVCVTLLVWAAAAAGSLLARLAANWRQRSLAAALVLVYLGAGWTISRPTDELHYYGPLSTYPPGTTLRETLPGQPPVAYTINAHGFRVPRFDEAKRQGILRVVLLGDSFVFGIGVDDDGTLHQSLAGVLERRWPAHSFEVVNLGIPGNNLASHVTMYETAVERLEPDAVILALTLANDLSSWDEQDARRDARSLSLFSLARFLFGDAAEAIWAMLYLERETTAAGLAHLDREIDRLAAIRAAARRTPLLVLFSFQSWGPPVAQRLEAVADAVRIPDRAARADEFIPGDGHPTPLGNTRFAAHIADTLAASRAWQQLLAAPAGGRP